MCTGCNEIKDIIKYYTKELTPTQIEIASKEGIFEEEIIRLRMISPRRLEQLKCIQRSLRKDKLLNVALTIMEGKTEDFLALGLKI